jgi:hypothetical protein
MSLVALLANHRPYQSSSSEKQKERNEIKFYGHENLQICHIIVETEIIVIKMPSRRPGWPSKALKSLLALFAIMHPQKTTKKKLTNNHCQP